jgi:hypothetical protein
MAMLSQHEIYIEEDDLNGAVLLVDFLAIIEKRIQSVPKEYRDNVLVRFGGGNAHLEFIYYAPKGPMLVVSNKRM